MFRILLPIFLLFGIKGYAIEAHYAEYMLSLYESTVGSDIYEVEGNSVYKLKKECSGWNASEELLVFFKTKNNGQFYAKNWTLKNPFSNKEVFTTRADSYILIDPTCSKIAVVDSKYFSGLFNNQTSNVCKFKVYKDEVDMIFDGTGRIPVVEDIPAVSEYDLMEAIWKL